MAPTNNSQLKKESVVLELISNKQLSEFEKSNDLLFSGKIAMKREGGFKKLYNLPAPSLLDRLAAQYATMLDVLSVRIKHTGWLCNRDSGWNKNLCILFASHGLLFIYMKPTQGYALKLSYGLGMEIFCGRKKVLPIDSSVDKYQMKVKFGFGAVEFHLTKVQTEKWRQPLLNAFEGKMSSFERTTKITTPLRVEPSTCDVELKTNSTTSDSESLGVASLFKSPPGKLTTCQETSNILPINTASLIKGDLNDDYMAIKLFLDKLKGFDSSITVYPDSIASKDDDNSKNDECDSGVECDEERDKMHEKFRPIPSVRTSILENKLSHLAPITSKPKATSHLSIAEIKTIPINRKTDTAFDLPVYRLETEREKLSRREPQTRITEKIHYFEQILENGARESPKSCATSFI